MAKKPRKIAVFCGFDNGNKYNRTRDNDVTEKAFAYRVLCACDAGKIADAQKDKGIGNTKLNLGHYPHPDFHHYHFSILHKWDSENIPEGDMRILKKCDAVLAIFPERFADDKVTLHPKAGNWPTSLYTLTEACYAKGMGKPVCVVLEEPLEKDHLKLLGEQIRFFTTDRHKIMNDTVAAELHNLFETNLQRWDGELRYIEAWPETELDELYEELTRIVLEAEKLWIYNHSTLPLCSQIDPFFQEPHRYCNFNGVMGAWNSVKHRALYFEVEEALITGTWTRVDNLLNRIGEQQFRNAPIRELIEERRNLNKPLKLNRAASIVVGSSYEDVKKRKNNEAQNRILARYLSVLAQAYRLTNFEYPYKNTDTYNLNIFPTVATQSVPTTLYAQKGASQDENKRGIWGFLRTPGSPTQAPFQDRFVVAQNHEIIGPWQQHVGYYFDNNVMEKYDATTCLQAWQFNSESFFQIIGQDAADDLIEFARKLHHEGQNGATNINKKKGFMLWLEQIKESGLAKLHKAEQKES